MDFSKPEKYLSEIYEFLAGQSSSNQSLLPEKQSYLSNSTKGNYGIAGLSFNKKGFNQINGSDAQTLINELLKIIFTPSMHQTGQVKFNTSEVKTLFAFLKYPHAIRNDAITAVGAPSSLGFLIKALYWLYILASCHS